MERADHDNNGAWYDKAVVSRIQSLYSDLGLTLGMGVVLALTFMGMTIAVSPIFCFAVAFLLALTGFYQRRGKHLKQQCKQSPCQEWIHTVRENVRAVRILVSKNRGIFLYRRYVVFGYFTIPSALSFIIPRNFN